MESKEKRPTSLTTKGLSGEIPFHAHPTTTPKDATQLFKCHYFRPRPVQSLLITYMNEFLLASSRQFSIVLRTRAGAEVCSRLFR